MFSPITLQDRSQLQPIIRQWNFENSDVCFSNLLMWQPTMQTEYALTEQALFIRSYTSKGQMFMQPPILRSDEILFSDALETALKIFDEEKQAPFFLGVTPDVCARMEQAKPNFFTFEHDIFSDDYIYDAEKMRTLSGKKMHNKRNHIKKFTSFYSFRYEVYDETKHVDACLALNDRWQEHKEDDEGFINGDQQAIECALLNASALHLKGGVVFINDQIEAFTLGEQLTDKMALIHIEKANADINGLYPFINQQFVQTAWPDMEWINREEDMGVENIRRAKESYYPERMIEKYSAKKKG